MFSLKCCYGSDEMNEIKIYRENIAKVHFIANKIKLKLSNFYLHIINVNSH